MSARHAGAYLRRLFDAQTRSKTQLEAETGVSDTTLGRILNGTHNSGGEDWARVCKALGGSADDLIGLLAGINLPDDRGEVLAELWLGRQAKSEVDKLKAKFGEDAVKRALESS